MGLTGNLTARTAATFTALVAIFALAACGGGSDGSSPINNSQAPAQDGSQGASDATVNVSFFDSIFMKGTGAGYFQFDATPNPNTTTNKPTAIGRTEFFVEADTNSNVSATTSTIAGDFQQRYIAATFITSDGAFTTQSTPFTDFGTNSKIFQKLSQGFELGMQEMSAPLYRVDVTKRDISGQPIRKAIEMDEGAYNNGMYSLLSEDQSPMPQGSQIYDEPATVLQTYVETSFTSASYSANSLEELQTRFGGSIESLGGYRYLKRDQYGENQLRTVIVERDGKFYVATLLLPGDVITYAPAAYNRIAADFIAQRETANLPQ